MSDYTATIHVTERSDSKPDERYFDGWVEGCANVVSKPQMFAMSSHNAISWRVKTVSELLSFARETGKDISIFNDLHGYKDQETVK